MQLAAVKKDMESLDPSGLDIMFFFPARAIYRKDRWGRKIEDFGVLCFCKEAAVFLQAAEAPSASFFGISVLFGLLGYFVDLVGNLLRGTFKRQDLALREQQNLVSSFSKEVMLRCLGVCPSNSFKQHFFLSS